MYIFVNTRKWCHRTKRPTFSIWTWNCNSLLQNRILRSLVLWWPKLVVQ